MKSKFFTAILAIIVVLMAMPLDASAQKLSRSGEEYSITINPLLLLINEELYVCFEKRINNKNSFTITGHYSFFSEYWQGYGIGGSYRWYFDAFDQGTRSFKGLGVGPFAQLLYWSYNPPASSFDWDWDGGYLVIGGEVVYKWIFDGFVLEPIFRLGVGVAAGVEELGNFKTWGVGLNIGYAWGG